MGADDPNGEEAGKVFLEANKAKEGVLTLPSGLQYRVIEEGAGLEHPTVGTPCECHYAGRLLDGTEFASSYKRGTPTTFAPNQVIKVRCAILCNCAQFSESRTLYRAGPRRCS